MKRLIPVGSILIGVATTLQSPTIFLEKNINNIKYIKILSEFY